MEKKLEQRHLAAYLPYILELEIVNTKKGYYLNGISKDTVVHVNHDNYLGFTCHILDVKPILRPLSDLTKEIEVNGEKFTPMTKLPWRAVFYEVEATKKYIESGSLEYRLIEILLSWHFDIFGLIDAGLAIDINTLKNQ